VLRVLWSYLLRLRLLAEARDGRYEHARDNSTDEPAFPPRGFISRVFFPRQTSRCIYFSGDR
jgi:hypothetical protein